MNATVVLLMVLVGVQALPRYNSENAEWKAYKLEYGKNYSPEEDIWHFTLYKNTKEYIKAHNKLYDNHLSPYAVGISQLADMRGNGTKALSHDDPRVVEWNDYKLRYAKNYSPEEDIWRFEVYETNKWLVETYNKLYENHLLSYCPNGINQFADMRDDELV